MSIGGEIPHGACCLNGHVSEENEREWSNLLIVDEVSIAFRVTMAKLNDELKLLLDSPMKHYGGMPILFTGDFLDLPPICALPFFLFKDFQP